MVQKFGCVKVQERKQEKDKACLENFAFEKHLQPLFWLLGHLGVKSPIFHVDEIHICSSQGSHYVSRMELLPPHMNRNNTTFTSRATL